MWCRFTHKEILELVNYQLENNWGKKLLSLDDFLEIEQALRRLEKCFSKARSPYFRMEEQVAFKIEHSVQYSIFLYLFSNELYKAGKIEKASFVYYLNKIMNSVELFYAVELPEHFCAEHPLGTVLGRAVYGDYFFVYQGVTVGGNQKGNKIHYPVIGNHVTMYSNSKILGNSYIGNNVIIAANAYIKDMNIPDNSIVFGEWPNVTIKSNAFDKIKEVNEHLWL